MSSSTPRSRWWSPRTRSRWTRSSPLRDQLPGSAHRRLRRPAGHGPLPARVAPVLRRRPGARARFGQEHPGFFEAEIDQGRPDDVAMFAYTSGTTGNPKGAMLTQQNVVWTGANLHQGRGRPPRRRVARLPAHGLGRRLPLHDGDQSLVGFTVNCPESPETVQRDLRELGPTAVLAPAAYLGKHADAVFRCGPPMPRRSSAGSSSACGRPPRRRSSCAATASRSRLALRARWALGEFLVYGPVRDQLGLRRARWAYTGGAPLGPDTYRFFRSFGVNLKQVYGSTETTRPRLAAARRRGRSDHGRARPARASTCSIGERGEVLVRSAGIFKGYYKNDEATREVIDGEGWFHTGDAGFVDPRGHLVIIDRAKDVGARTTARRSPRSSSRTSSSSAPTSARRWPSATSGRSWPPWSPSTSSTVGNWAERRGSPTPATWTSARSRRCAP